MSQETTIAARVETAIAPLLEGQGYELVLLEYVPRQRTLRLYIDRQGGVTIDDCSKVSRLVGDVLDAEGLSDAIEGRYHLEVSSPGLDRPLVKPSDFVRFAGHKIQLSTKEPLLGRRKFSGELALADAQGIEVHVDGKPWRIDYLQIERARLVPEL